MKVGSCFRCCTVILGFFLSPSLLSLSSFYVALSYMVIIPLSASRSVPYPSFFAYQGAPLGLSVIMHDDGKLRTQRYEVGFRDAWRAWHEDPKLVRYGNMAASWGHR